MVNELYVFLTETILCLKNVLVVQHYFIKILHVISDSPSCSKSYCSYQELSQGDIYWLDQEKVSFQVIYYLTKGKVMLTQVIDNIPHA